MNDLTTGRCWHRSIKLSFGHGCVCLAFALVIGIALSATAPAQETIKPRAYPLNVIQDSASFTFYLNEDVLVRNHGELRADGSYSGEYTLSVSGQSVSSAMQIKVDNKGNWTSITMTTPQGPVDVECGDTLVKITFMNQTKLMALKPGTIVFENFSPILMSQAVMAYDQKTGGKQTFPLFVIPQAVMEGSLERLETAERNVMGAYHTFTIYRYGLPGVDVTLWVDEHNRVCYGDVPAQHGAYVRSGYESLRLKPESDSLLSQAKYDVAVDQSVEVPMRDGIKLATDIYRPKAEGKFPVVLIRTPYKKEMNDLQAKYFARRGYVCAVQDCRGRFGSAGTWEPFFNEPKDGYDAIEWLAVQPWSNGKVGMIGASYVGWVQWWAAREKPPHLTTIVPNVSPPDPYYNIPYEYGSFFMFGAIWWANILEQEATGDISGKAIHDVNSKKYGKLLRHLPVIDLDSIVLGKPNKYWRDWIAHPDNDAYWDRGSFLGRLKDVDIPVFHQSGWYDGDGIGTKLNYAAMASAGHKYQKLVIGPWGHSSEATRQGPNDVDFGPNAIVDLERAYMRWMDHWLLGIDNGIDREPLVSLFVMGSNQWLEGNIYPLPETKFTKYYLTSTGRANSSDGNGMLSVSPPAGAATDTFTYDPGNPTPEPLFYTNPDDLKDEKPADSNQAKSIDEALAKQRAYYATVDKERSDILVYDTPPMTEPLTIVGPISAVLYAGSSAKDTDWHMRLSTINEKGEVYPLVHGVIRARYRNSMAKPELLKPDNVYEYHLDMWQTGITVPAGSKLRVEVASAAFPMFSRNLNTGGHNETETAFVSAKQTIYHDSDHLSYVLLPVIPSPQFKPTIGK